MATAREYLTSLYAALADLAVMEEVTDADLEDWIDDLRGAEERICMMVFCLMDELGLSADDLEERKR